MSSNLVHRIESPMRFKPVLYSGPPLAELPKCTATAEWEKILDCLAL